MWLGFFHINKWLTSLFSFGFLEWDGKQDASQSESDTDPTPVVIIDQDSDPDATIVEITFGDRLGALIDTVWRLTSVIWYLMFES